MKRSFTAAIFSIVLLAVQTALANDTMLPFPVKVGGQAAVLANPSDTIAKVADPVADDAELEVEISGDVPMVIINAYPSDASGAVKEGASPAILLAQGSKKLKLSDTMDKKKLPAGYYALNIVAAEKTSRVLIQIK